MSVSLQGLISVLLDWNEDPYVREEAAFSLQRFPCQEALDALLEVACRTDQHHELLDSCGESIGLIWCDWGEFDPKQAKALSSVARRAARFVVSRTRPEWLEKFDAAVEDA